jgi:uncharacterized 2Fe-2S/4Fe-4S cluster protein (DUF4445 family)
VTSKITIEFRPQDKTTRVPPGMTIFNAANWIGLPIDSTCGGRGTCGKCKVRVLEGQAGITVADRKVFPDGELSEGWRLSCRAEVHVDTICEVPRLMGNPQAALMGFGRHVVLDPNLHKVLQEGVRFDHGAGPSAGGNPPTHALCQQSLADRSLSIDCQDQASLPGRRPLLEQPLDKTRYSSLVRSRNE